MNHFEEDEALARLKGADPATGAHPDLHRIGERLRGRTPLGAGSTDPSHNSSEGGSATGGTPRGYSYTGTSDGAIRVTDPGVRTGRGGLLVAAAVASLALGGGGYALGLNNAGDAPQVTPNNESAQDAGPRVQTPTREVGPAASDPFGASDGDGSESMSGQAAEDSAMGGEGFASSDGGDYAGPVVPVAGDGLSTERTTGPVYGPGESTQEPSALLQEYADRLGIEGEIESDEWSAYLVASSGQPISLNAWVNGGTSSLDYSNVAVDPSCEDYRQEWVASGGEGGWFGPGPQTPEDLVCAETGDAPDDAAAITHVSEFLARAGIDTAGLAFTVEDYDEWVEPMDDEGGDSTSATSMPGDDVSATAAPDEDGGTDDASEPMYGGPSGTVSVTVTDESAAMPHYRPWHFSVSSAGVAYASVQVGELVELGDYPVISAAEAVERANDARFMQLGAYIPDLDYSSTYIEEWTAPTPLPPISAGDPIPFPVSEGVVTSAELHTGVIGMWDGTEYVVPVWALSDGDGNQWQVFGVAEEALDFTP